MSTRCRSVPTTVSPSFVQLETCSSPLWGGAALSDEPAAVAVVTREKVLIEGRVALETRSPPGVGGAPGLGVAEAETSLDFGGALGLDAALIRIVRRVRDGVQDVARAFQLHVVEFRARLAVLFAERVELAVC